MNYFIFYSEENKDVIEKMYGTLSTMFPYYLINPNNILCNVNLSEKLQLLKDIKDQDIPFSTKVMIFSIPENTEAKMIKQDYNIQIESIIRPEIIEQINLVVNKQYEKYKPYNIPKNIDNIFLDYQKNLDGLIVRYIIDNDNKNDKEFVNIDKTFYDMMYNNLVETKRKKGRKLEADNRAEVILNIIRKSLKYAKNNNKPIPNTHLYIFISDHNIWYDPNKPETEIILKIPIMCLAKPNDQPNPIFPETTFEHFSFESKFDYEKSLSWQQSVEIINKHIKDYKDNKLKRENSIFFRGAYTGSYSHNIRTNIFKDYEKQYEKEKKSNIITLEHSGRNNYTPIYDWYKYKYQLNLPGHYPWSNRFKYILLLDSICINVNVNTINYDKNRSIIYKDAPYITFIDLFVDNTEYIEYIYNFEMIDSIPIHQIEKTKELYSFISNTVNKLNNDDSFYNEWYNKGQKIKDRLESLTDNAIYEYIYECIIKNSELVN